MGLRRLLGFRKGQALAALILLAIAYSAAPEFFDDALIVVWVVVAYLLGYYFHYFFRRYFFRRVVAFDLGGVLVTGDSLTEELHECPGIRKLLKDLREKYLIAILSNNNALLRYGMEKKFGFDSLFDEIIFSSQSGSKKPDEGIYRYLLKRFGVNASRVVFVDDQAANLATARKLGMQAIEFDCSKQNVRQLRVALREAGISV